MVQNLKLVLKAKANVCAWGDFKLKGTAAEHFCECFLRNVLHFPYFEHSLISVSIMDPKGILTTFEIGQCTVRENGKQILIGLLRRSPYAIADTVALRQ